MKKVPCWVERVDDVARKRHEEKVQVQGVVVIERADRYRISSSNDTLNHLFCFVSS